MDANRFKYFHECLKNGNIRLARANSCLVIICLLQYMYPIRQRTKSLTSNNRLNTTFTFTSHLQTALYCVTQTAGFSVDSYTFNKHSFHSAFLETLYFSMKTWVHQHSAKLAGLGSQEDPTNRPTTWESGDFPRENEVLRVCSNFCIFRSRMRF